MLADNGSIKKGDQHFFMVGSESFSDFFRGIFNACAAPIFLLVQTPDNRL